MDTTSQNPTGLLKPAQGFTLKKGIKEVLGTALQASLQSSFWSTLSPQMGQVAPGTVVLAEYPQEAYNHFPFIRYSVNIDSAVWSSINASTGEGIERAFSGKGSCLLDIWSISAPQRDALFDALTVLLLLRENTGADIFDEVLADAWTNKGYPRINPNFQSVDLGADDDGTGLPWSPQTQMFTSSIRFDFSYIQSFGGLSQNLDITKVTAKPTLSD